MTQVIYVLISSGGEYDDAWHRNVAASTDRELLVRREAAERAEDEARRLEIEGYFEALNEWRAANPFSASEEKLLEVKRWSAGLGEKDITPEMRAERARVLLYNDEVQRKVGAALDAYAVREKEHLAALGFTKGGHDYYQVTENGAILYEIEELELLSPPVDASS